MQIYICMYVHTTYNVYTRIWLPKGGFFRRLAGSFHSVSLLARSHPPTTRDVYA